MPNDKDVLVQSSFRVPDGSSISAKPCHLITLCFERSSKATSVPNQFISLDKPDFTQAGWVQVKGFFYGQDEEVILAGFKQIVHEKGKEEITEMYFPRHEVKRIRSLVFKAK